jgi:hypothetical protein
VCEKRALNIMETERPRKGWGGGGEGTGGTNARCHGITNYERTMLSFRAQLSLLLGSFLPQR